MNQLAIVVYCGVLMSISSFAIDITLPSLPDIVARLDAPYATVQWSITAYLGSAGIAQIVWGPASDRFGRKPVMAAGLSLFLVGCVVAALAPSIGWLLAGRVVQGFGAAAAIVLARAILRDLYSGQELARSLALGMAIFAVGPMLAPLAGAAVGVFFGWRAVFVLLGILGLALLLPLLWMRETLAERSPHAMRPAVMRARIIRLFAHPQSRYFLLLSVPVMAIMVFNLSALPRVYDLSFGVTGVAFALLVALHGVGIVIGQLTNRRLIPIFGTVPAMLAANVVLLVSAGLILAFTLAGWISAYLMTGLLIFFTLGYLVMFSNSAAMVLDPHGDIAGFAAAVFGVVSQIGAALLVTLLVVFAGGSVLAYTLVLLGICSVTFVFTALWLFLHGSGVEPRSTEGMPGG